MHRHRGTSDDQRGGGVALVYRDVIKATTIDVQRLHRVRVAGCQAHRSSLQVFGRCLCLQTAWDPVSYTHLTLPTILRV